MPVRWAPESEYAKERVKWEAFPTELGMPGRPYQKHVYPMWLFKGGRRDGMTPDIVDQQKATTDLEKANLQSRGFCESPADALTAFHAEELEHAKLAAERAYDVRNRLSSQAGAEVAAAEAAHDGHLPSMPVTAIKRRGRPAKVNN